ncbi:MAG: hypothetical protein ABI865_14860 [Nitrosospira sp.]
MSKFILTVILSAFTAVYSLGAVAADTSDNTTRDSKEKKWEDKYEKGGRGNTSTSEIMENKEPKDLSPKEKYEYRDQEVMNEKPYKQPK